MPGPVSDSIHPEWGTSGNAAALEEALTDMHTLLGDIIGAEPKYILNVVFDDDEADERVVASSLTRRQWRMLRFACERARENL